MVTTFTVPLSKVMKELALEVVYLPTSADEILISSRDVNRPGLELNGFYDYYDKNRILIFGNAETALLASFTREKRASVLGELFSRKPPAVIVARNITPAPEMVEAAREYGVALLKTVDTTSNLVAALVAYMNTELAPRITRHGVLVEVYGEGILLVGDSGVGKSETAIELIKRGHRLIADDAVEIRRVSNKTLVGSAPENIRHFIELRGIGIVNVARIFGIGSVKVSEKVDLVVDLEPWDKTKNYSRTGLETDFYDILGVQIPKTVIPVMPGRNLAVILETAAINNRQKKMGYNAAKELLARLGLDEDIGI